MQPLTLNQRALHTWVAVGRRSARGGGSESALCPSFFSLRKSLGAGGDQSELSTGGAGAAGSRAGFCPHSMEALISPPINSQKFPFDSFLLK